MVSHGQERKYLENQEGKTPRNINNNNNNNHLYLFRTYYIPGAVAMCVFKLTWPS